MHGIDLYHAACTTEIDFHPRLKAFLDARQCQKTMTWLGMYRSNTAKPIKLISSDVFIRFLYRKLNRAWVPKSVAAVRKTMPDGRVTYQGTKHLRETQHYPRAFGKQAGFKFVPCLCNIYIYNIGCANLNI